MLNVKEYVVIKNTFTGLFWDISNKKWMIPSSESDVILCSLGTFGEDDDLVIQDKFKSIMDDIPKDCFGDIRPSVIKLETHIIF